MAFLFNRIEKHKHNKFKKNISRILSVLLTLCLIGATITGPFGQKTSASFKTTTAIKTEDNILNEQMQTSRGDLSRSDVILLAKVIEGEAADQSLEGKVAVGSVIMNRIENDSFPNNISGVIYQPMAFESVLNGEYNRPLTNESIKAADLAMQGMDPTGGAVYFWNPEKTSNAWLMKRKITAEIGNHVFAE